MGESKVTALYDFQGEPGTAELSIVAGEILTVTRNDVGEGWWEGINSQGKTGLFPAAYVEASGSAPPEQPPPMLDPEQETWDDDWDDDTYSEIGQPQQIYANSGPVVPLPAPPDDILVDNKVNKKNRFSTFDKFGVDGYIFGDTKMQISEADKIYITMNEEGVFWPMITQYYTVQVASPKKESKLKGLKSFIAYQLTPSFNNIQVSRRYKHFDWLHERLSDKFCVIPIPPLPDKQISNRYDESFIEHRRIQLQSFVDWICRHPVLSTCEVWQHFLTCTDDKRWKLGKRQAEKDQLTGAKFCLLIESPEKLLLASVLDPQIDKCANFMHAMENGIKNLMLTSQEQSKRHQGPYKREFQRIGECIFSLGNSIELDAPSTLADAIKRTGGTYIEISRLYEEQCKYDWEPLSDFLHLYRGITTSFPDVLSVQKVAMNKRKESEKLTSDQKMNVAELNEVTRKTDVVNYAILAEISHFRNERSIDMNRAMKQFLQQQIHFYQNIVSKLQTTLELYEED